jgi:hypothetical protein
LVRQKDLEKNKYSRLGSSRKNYSRLAGVVEAKKKNILDMLRVEWLEKKKKKKNILG